MEKEGGLDSSAEVADMRFSFIGKVCGQTVVKSKASRERLRSEKIDRILTGKYTAIPCFIGIMGMALSQEQLEHGWDTEYLGYYQFAESYTSAQGFKVNILKDTVEEPPEDYVSEKSAVFVADGIEYIVKGRTSLENIKGIVDSME